MREFSRVETVYAEQWFPPEDSRHIPIKGMVKLPRHTIDQIDGDYHFTYKVEDTWVYWGDRVDSDFHPIYQPIRPGWWVVIKGYSTTVVEYFLEQGYEESTKSGK